MQSTCNICSNSSYNNTTKNELNKLNIPPLSRKMIKRVRFLFKNDSLLHTIVFCFRWTNWQFSGLLDSSTYGTSKQWPRETTWSSSSRIKWYHGVRGGERTMYYPLGLPRRLRVPGGAAHGQVKAIVCNRDRVLFAVLTEKSIWIWFSRVSGMITSSLFLLG